MKRLTRRIIWRVFWLSFQTSALATIEITAKLVRLRRRFFPWR